MKESLSLWNTEPPKYIDGEEKPELTYYPAERRRSSGAVLILPGGGYYKRSSYEGEGYALYLNSLGIDSFVLDYRVAPYRFPCPLLDARRAMRRIRELSERLSIDKNRIAVMGSSAGGHLASLLCTYHKPLEDEGRDATDKEEYRPSLQILCYPVIEPEGHKASFVNLTGMDTPCSLWEELTPSLIADEKAPPAFIWHTANDGSVNVDNTYNYAKTLRRLNVPCEMHVFPDGSHGLGLADESAPTQSPYVARWADMLAHWLAFYGFFK